MSNSVLKTSIVVAAASLASCVAGIALADDSSMSMWTGDSYAYFNNLEYSAGKFNMARAPRTDAPEAVAKTPQKPAEKVERSARVAVHPFKGTPLSPFRNDTGA